MEPKTNSAQESTTEKTMREKQKEEAALRLKMMGVSVRIRRDFERFGLVRLCGSPLGTYCEIPKEIKPLVEAFEKKYDATVYMVVRCNTSVGLLDSLLFVGKYEDEWEEEKLDIKEGYVMTYTINHLHDFCSEFGSIVYATTDFGGIVRLN